MKTDPRPPARKWMIPALLIGLAGLVFTVYHFNRGETIPPKTASDIPIVMGHREGCFLCHEEMIGFSQAHDPKVVGCSSCHLGDPLAAEKTTAHKGMIKIPGNMDTVMKSCGQAACHHDLVVKVNGSLMASGQGMVSVNRYVFGQTHSPDGPGHLSHLTQSAADTHLRQLCVTCHLGFPKKRSGPIDQTARGGGCTACHIDYTEKAKSQMAAYYQTEKLPTVHPALNINVGNDRCFGCHSRSARISLNYEGWHETMLKYKNVKNPDEYRILQDHRVLTYKGADVHHERGMLCIDCHSARDVMGDGTSYNHQGEQVEISCSDCHNPENGTFVAHQDLDSDSVKILQLRNAPDLKTNRYLAARKTGKPMVNLTRGPGGETRFTGKLDNRPRELKAPAEACTNISGHERLTCQTCHTRWAPSCIECHTQYLPDKKRKDHYTGEKVPGVWKEYKGDLRGVPPALGVRRDKRFNHDVVDTFIPGMVLTIGGIKNNRPDRNASSEKKTDHFQVFKRLFSPTFSHTIQTKSRSCQSCHRDPWAVGLGKGRIEYHVSTTGDQKISMTFFPTGKRHPADGLPRDAWTSFLKTRRLHTATRTGARPFNKKEQQRILTVGQCLFCHEANPANTATIYQRFEKAFQERTHQCLQKPKQP